MDFMKKIDLKNDALALFLGAVVAVAVAYAAIYLPKRKAEWLLNKKKMTTSGEFMVDHRKAYAIMALAAIVGFLAAAMFLAYNRRSMSAMGFRFAMESCGCAGY